MHADDCIDVTLMFLGGGYFKVYNYLIHSMAGVFWMERGGMKGAYTLQHAERKSPI